MNRNTIWNTLVVICVSMAELWNAEDSISDTIQLLRSHLDYLNLDDEEVAGLQESLQRQFQLYVEPNRQPEDANTETEKTISKLKHLHRMSTAVHSSGMPTNSLHPADALGTASDSVLVPIPEGTFKEKISVPVIILVTKADVIKTLEQEAGFKDDTFDVLQFRLREKALELGAALAYVSVKANINCELLTRYLRHRFFNTNFHSPAQVLEHETLFVPAGWDNKNRLNTLRSSLSDQIISEAEKLISTPPPRDLRMVLACVAAGLSVPRATEYMLGDSPLGIGGSESELVAEEEQSFLTKLYNQQHQQTSSSAKAGQQMEAAGRPLPTSRRTAHGAPNTSAKQPNKEAVLSNFFCSLLTKQSGSEKPRGKSPLSESTSLVPPTPPRASPSGQMETSGKQESGKHSAVDPNALLLTGDEQVANTKQVESRGDDSSIQKEPDAVVGGQHVSGAEYRVHEDPAQLTQQSGLPDEEVNLASAQLLPEDKDLDGNNATRQDGDLEANTNEDNVLKRVSGQLEDKEEVEVFNRQVLREFTEASEVEKPAARDLEADSAVNAQGQGDDNDSATGAVQTSTTRTEIEASDAEIKSDQLVSSEREDSSRRYSLEGDEHSLSDCRQQQQQQQEPLEQHETEQTIESSEDDYAVKKVPTRTAIGDCEEHGGQERGTAEFGTVLVGDENLEALSIQGQVIQSLEQEVTDVQENEDSTSTNAPIQSEDFEGVEELDGREIGNLTETLDGDTPVDRVPEADDGDGLQQDSNDTRVPVAASGCSVSDENIEESDRIGEPGICNLNVKMFT
uniref:Dynein light intermediate chain n=1 Tax=Schistocephalus solidus TaxID=70667 RepID=A0A0X3PLD4_SCHSO